MEIRIPSGLRDLAGSEALIRKNAENILLETFEKWGYELSLSPAIEYYQTYNKAFDNLEDREMYKFFDENGDILTLRMDMTVPIVRMACAHAIDLPARYCYSGSVWKARKPFAGKRSEVTDCGVELLGLDEDGDLEILILAIESLKALGLENFSLEIGDARFFLRAARKYLNSEEETAILADLIDRKSMVDLEAFLNSLDLEEKVRLFFLELPWLCGGDESLARAIQIAPDEEMLEVLMSILWLKESLQALGLDQYISFDLSRIPHVNYYTSLIFQAFIPGVGSAILSGGRYDTLTEKFGLQANARGFSIKLDTLLDLLPKPKAKKKILVHYPADQSLQANALALQLRRENTVVLMPDGPETITLEELWD